MQARLAAIAAGPLLAIVACSGSSGLAIPPASDDLGSDPAQPHAGDLGGPADGDEDAAAREDAATRDDGGADGGSDSGAARDAAADARPDGGGSACDACLGASAPAGCKAELDACMTHPTCKLLDACLDACLTSACRSACFVTYPDPEAKARNGALYKCQCTTNCALACKVECS